MLRRIAAAAGHRRQPCRWCACRRSSSSSLTATGDQPVVLSFPQWQGACGGADDDDARPRYQAGAAALRRSMRNLLPMATHLQVAIEEEGEDNSRPADPLTYPDPSTTAGITAAAARWGPIRRQQQEAAALLKESAAAGGTTITLGGDCGVEPVPIGHANALHEGNMAVLWLDSHGDLNSVAESPSKNFHGMALRALFDPLCCGYSEDAAAEVIPLPLLPRQVVMAGVRSLDAGEEDFIASKSLPVFTPTELTQSGGGSRTIQGGGSDGAADTAGLIAALKDSAGMADPAVALYIHLDLDVLEPSQFPHVCVPEANGISPSVLLGICKDLQHEFGTRICGLSVTELAPTPNARPQQVAAACGLVERVVEELLPALRR